MQKGKECNVKKREGSSETVKIGNKQEKPLATCKNKCLNKGAVACGYDFTTRECTIVYQGGLKGVSVSHTGCNQY